MRKTEMERTLDTIGVRARDESGSLWSADDLTVDVMKLLDQCDAEDRGRLLFLLALSNYMDKEEL